MTMPLVNQQQQGLIAQGNPAYTEITRQGVGYNCSLAAAAAPIVTFPTTVALLEIFNNTSGASSVNLIIDSLFAFNLLGVVTTAHTEAIWAMVTTQKAAPSFTTLNIFSHSGRPVQATVAGGRIITGVGTTGLTANGWRPWGNVCPWYVGAATPGQSMEAYVGGRLIVPPSTSLCMTIVSSALTTVTWTCGASWYEEPFVNVV